MDDMKKRLPPPLACMAASLAVLLQLSPGAKAAGATCPDMFVTSQDLDAILDQTLGGLRAAVDQRSVSVDPGNPACYLQISLSTTALAQLVPDCRLQACTTVIHRPKSLALDEFDIRGCDPLFLALGVSRRVRSTFADASGRIRRQCGSDAFNIDAVEPVRIDGEPRLRITFRPAAKTQGAAQ